MGATAWSYWVDWRGDAAASLEALKQREFAAGAYHGGSSRRAKPPKSIATLLRRVGELGTHSILDIMSLAGERGLYVAAPLTDDQLDALFGTLFPTRAQIEAEERVLRLIRPRGEATFIIAYEGGRPTEIYFTGVTGT